MTLSYFLLITRHFPCSISDAFNSTKQTSAQEKYSSQTRLSSLLSGEIRNGLFAKTNEDKENPTEGSPVVRTHARCLFNKKESTSHYHADPVEGING